MAAKKKTAKKAATKKTAANSPKATSPAPAAIRNAQFLVSVLIAPTSSLWTGDPG